MKCAPSAKWGWAGVKNGRLLQLAEQHFDVLVTVDRNLEFQQNLQALSLVVVVLVAVSNEFDVLKRLMPTLGESLSRRLDGAVVYISR